MSRHENRRPGGHGFAIPVQKPKDFKKTFRRLMLYLKPHCANLILVLAFAILSTVFTIVSPKVTGMAINKMKDGFVSRIVLEQLSQMQSNLKKFDSLDNVQSMLDKKTIDQIKKINQLPDLNKIDDNKEKAAVCKRLIDFISKMPEQYVKQDKKISFTQEQIDDAIRAVEETGGKIDFEYIGKVLVLLIGMYLLSLGFGVMMGFVMSNVAQTTVMQLRKDVDRKLGRLPLKYFDAKTHGEILSRVTNDVDTISNTLQQSITQVITSIISLIGYIIMMISISPLLTLMVLGTLPLYIFATAFIAKKSQSLFKLQQKHLGMLNGHVEEMLSGHIIIKAYVKEQDSINKFREINNELYKASWKANFVSGVMFPLMNFISNLGYVLICVAGGIWMTGNRLRLGDITAFIQYSRSFTMPIIQTANIANIIQSTIACAERVFEILDEEEELKDAKDSIELDSVKGNITFENVYFSYNPEQRLIENFNLEVKQGETVAIVGPTGAGKTTLVNLLMRFYEINEGQILIDGILSTHIKRSNLRSLFGMVLQDTWLFNGTIKDNIAYGKLDASDEEIINAARAAHADWFIRTLPEGYNTVINEEANNISQGQKQLLTIARAILANPSIMILDEATSSVDTRTETLIQKAMKSLMKNRTSFIIAHRLSTIKDADRIIVLNKGNIVETGTHEELLAKNGFYADLYNSQFSII